MKPFHPRSAGWVSYILRIDGKISEEKETQLKERLGQAIAIIPGKSESWLMLAIEGEIPMYFRGDNSEPVAFIEIKTFGSASSDVYEKMTKELTKTA